MTGEDVLKEGERRTVTVLFTDMKGYTDLSRRLDPEEMDALMTDIFSRLEAIVDGYEGHVEKYIGDAMVAVFGVRKTHEDDACRAVNAAIDLNDRISEMNEGRPAGAAKVSFRSGIHTGLIATGRRGEFDVVTGSTMSLAARLEAAAGPGTIMVSEVTRSVCLEEFDFSEPVSLSLPGFQGPVTAYAVSGRKENPFDYDGPFLGRDDLIAHMMKSYLRHDRSTTSGFILRGEAGVGKSRIAAEFLRRVRQLPDNAVPVLHARAKVIRPERFSVIRELLLAHFHIRNPVSPEEVKKKVLSELGTDEEVASMFARYVCGQAEDLQESRLVLYLHLILSGIVTSCEAQVFSPILCIDNYHYIDKQSRDFFRFYLQGAVSKLFFLFVGRTESAEFSKVFRDLETIDIPRLSKRVSSDLIRELWNGPCEEATVAGIVENADGVPLFIEEYVRYMKSHGDTQLLPLTVQNIFLSQLEEYDERMRDLLLKLSAFRQDFTVEYATHIHRETGGEPEMVRPVLEFFVREGVLRKDDELYRFRHDMLKRTLYNTLLNFNKKILHRVIAEKLRADKIPNVTGLLYHFSRAEEYGEVERILLDTPAQTTNIDFLPYYNRLIERRKDVHDSEYLMLVFSKAAVLFNNGRTQETVGMLGEMIHIGISDGNTQYLARAYHLLEGFYAKSYDFMKTRFFAVKALDNYRMVDPDHRSLQNVLRILADTELYAGDIEACGRIIEQMESGKRFQRVGEKDLAVLRRLSALGEYAEALDLIRGRLAAVLDTGTLEWASLMDEAARIYWEACDFEELESVAESLLGDPSNTPLDMCTYYSFAASGAGFRGETERCRLHIQQALYYLSQIPNEYDTLEAVTTIVPVLLLLKDYARFTELAQRGLEIGLRNACYRPTFSLLVLMADHFMDQGDAKKTEFFLREADSIESRHVLLRGRDLILYYYLWSVITDEHESRELLARSRALLDGEVQRLYDDRLRERMLSTRCYSRIVDAGE